MNQEKTNLQKSTMKKESIYHSLIDITSKAFWHILVFQRLFLSYIISHILIHSKDLENMKYNIYYWLFSMTFLKNSLEIILTVICNENEDKLLNNKVCSGWVCFFFQT